ncbi:MAG TPA: aspartyl protease family protein [Blastocatellia bacterium]|nr:aspartyl protease family protein [Blastocatellia bacterium]
MSRHHQTYSHLYDYSRFSSRGITLPVTLISGTGNLLDLRGILDTGSPFCVLEKHNAEMLGLDLLSGSAQRISTAAGSFTAYGHEVIIQLFDYQWEATVYFHESEGFSRNIPGRTGFADHLRIGLVDYDETIFIGLYGDEDE